MRFNFITKDLHALTPNTPMTNYSQGLINGEEGMHSNTRFAHGKIQMWRQDILNLVTFGSYIAYSYKSMAFTEPRNYSVQAEESPMAWYVTILQLKFYSTL